jgi:hypothetical protein
MTRTTTLAVVAFSASCVFAATFALEAIIARHTNLIAKEVESKIIRVRAGNDRQTRTASFVVAYVRTTLELNYTSPVRKGSSATVTARIEQTEIFRRDPSFPDDGGGVPEDQQINTLKWPITVTLASAAFRFASSEEHKKLAEGSHLPAVIRWAPVAESEGDADFILHFSNIEGAKDLSGYHSPERFLSMDINGKPGVFGVDDDVPLPISIYTVQGVPAWLWAYITAAGAVASVLLGSALVAGLVLPLWAHAGGRPQEPRTPNDARQSPSRKKRRR